ncbi:hypothetical protein GE061_018100 [Apolygus lucorum]|uniref:DUF4794 domain-containing protein n=1 Tax=Apolygus lucorum TaxID=248454 RepID=A0A8S9XEB6_APOLU|nr:hypothetical protein GE061_018100 [Apolygus lucorum]
MFGVFVVTVCLPLALGLPDAYGVPPPITADIPSQGIEPAVQAGVDHKLFFDNSQNQAHVKEVPSSPADQPEAASISSPLQYGVPSVDQTLKNSYSVEASVGQSAQENSDKALSYNSDRGNIEYLRSPQDVTNEELILSYRPEVVSMYDYDQDSGLEYARYAPSHSANTDAQNTRFASGNYGSIASKDQKYGIPPVESSVFKNSQHKLPEYPPEVYNPVHPAHYDYSGHRHETTKNDYHHIPSALREQVKNNGGIGSYQSPPVPVRYIAVFQKHRAPGRADVSTASYTTQPVGLLQPALVLPPSNYQAHSPSGSISSTFISKDAYQRRPLFTQKIFKDGVQLEALSDGDVSNPLPQSSYGLPNF